MEFSRRNKNLYDVDLENFPREVDHYDKSVPKEEADELRDMGLVDKIQVEDHMEELVKIEYDIVVYKDSAGISDIDFVLKSVRIEGEYEVWNTEKDDSESFNYEVEDLGPFDGRVEFETGILPWYPESFVVDMNDSFDPKNFRYTVKIGQ